MIEEGGVTTAGYFISPDLYDMIYASFVADIGVMVDEAKAAGGPVLEVCCGSGRLLVPICEAGVDADGLDYDVSMLESARGKLAARGLRANLHLGDMRSFELDRRYALVMIAFNSFLHNLTQEDQLRTLARVRHHLAPGGRLALMCFHPSAKRLATADAGPTLAVDSPLPDGGRVRAYDSLAPDQVRQENHVRRHVERLDAAGQVVETRDYEFQIRYVYTPEMELLLRVSGFARWEVCSPMSGYAGERYVPARAPAAGGVHLWRAWRD